MLKKTFGWSRQELLAFLEGLSRKTEGQFSRDDVIGQRTSEALSLSIAVLAH